MKKFIIKCLCLAGVLFLMLFAGDFVVTNGLKKTGDSEGLGYQEFTTWNEIVSSSINANVLINGTSRAYRHINPMILDTLLNCKSYNIGMSDAEFSKQYVRFKTFEKYNPKPDFIIQQVDYWTLSISDSDYDDRILPYLKDIDKDLIDKYLKWVEFYYLKIPLLKYYSQPTQIFRGTVEFFKIKHYTNSRTKGFIATDSTWNSTAFNLILKQDSLIACRDPEAILLFDSYLRYCKENGIYVYMVFSPQYYKATEFTKGKQEVLDIYKIFSKKYDFPFLDYSNDTICYDTVYFYNATHLNRRGAEIFTRKLAKDINF